MKRLLVLVTLVTSTAVADWLDEVVKLVVHYDSLPQKQVQEVMHKYIKEDKDQIAALEKKECEEKEKGLLSSVRATTYQMEIKSLHATLRYHESVARYFKELSENKKDRDSFVQHAQKLHILETELRHLERRYDENERTAQKIGLTAKITAKKAEVQTKRAYLKAVKFRGN